MTKLINDEFENSVKQGFASLRHMESMTSLILERVPQSLEELTNELSIKNDYQNFIILVCKYILEVSKSF